MKVNYEKYKDVFEKHGFKLGRLLSFSKGLYKTLYPKNFVLFNANIITRNTGKIWYGDLDLTKDEKVLKKISKEINKELFVLREIDCRFENEKLPFKVLKKRAIWSSKEGLLVKSYLKNFLSSLKKKV
uniref:Uncharacterized protein n=1 Tax=Dictyoglomus turgidum TaxID=513050 RepID=A0A7C3SML6_9BACT